MARGKKTRPVPAAAERTVPPDGALPGDKQPGPVPVAVVGIGASAGGLDAMSKLLEALPDDTGMAFVIVSHLSPTHESMLAEILSRKTAMRVLEVHDEPVVLANHVYVIPPGRNVAIDRGVLRLFARTETGGPHHPVDVFLHSLAEDQGHRSIGVILSGTANDGTLGLEKIKAQGGLTFAQDASAQHDGMPQSAIASGCVDFVLSPAGIAAELTHIAHHSQFNAPDAASSRASEQPGIVRILQMLQAEFGTDFSRYRRNMLHRRITRRMVLQKIAGIREYAKLLQKDPVELESLYRDVMINVTSFFRDPDAFDALKAEVFPRLVANRARHDPIRVWSIGCSTGEEAYSLVIALTEFLDQQGQAVPVQVFATDLNDAAIEKARAGVYLRSVAHDVSPGRLRRFFFETSSGYRINKIIREMCIFAQHNVLTDPPFSRMDLISCRNLLIYLEPALQQKLIPAIHYALKPDGCLWLGSSETVGRFRSLFELENASQKIYCKKSLPARTAAMTSLHTAARLGRHAGAKPDRSRDPAAVAFDVHREAERVLLGRYTPPGVLVNGEMVILQFRGDTGPYLVPAPGKASLNLLKMLRDGLLVPVRGALARAKKQQAPVREEGLRFISSGGSRGISIEVIPVHGAAPADDCFLVLFEPGASSTAVRGAASRARKTTAATRAADRSETSRLTHELGATKDYLQSVIEQQEATNEELQSANEEIQSANEELQSINEELETSKEEIQSSNEELATVNEELRNRNVELAQNNNDLRNLLASVQMPILMLGADLRIRRFTPAAERLLNLITTDIGRPIGHIKLNVDLPDLESMVLDVIETAAPKQREVRDAEGCWFSVRVRPYRTADNTIEGAVVVLVDIDEIKRAEASVRESEARFRLLVDSAPVLIWVDDADGERFANRAYLEFVGVAERELRGKQWQEFIHREDLDRYLATYRDAASRNASFETQVRLRRADGQYRWLKSIATPRSRTGEFTGFVGSETDVADLKEAELALVHADQSKHEFLAMLAHELRNPLAPLHNVVQLLQAKDADQATVDWAWGALDRQIRNLTLLVDDLLDVSRITHGKINLRCEPTDLGAALRNAAQLVAPAISARHQSLVTDLPTHPMQVIADQLRLEQIVGNLLNNASKFTPEHGHIWLTAKQLTDAPMVEVSVRDDGIGIRADALPNIFELFTQGDRSLDRTHGGLGVGLTVVRRLVQLHGGEVSASSPGPGGGSEFVVRLPAIALAVPKLAPPAASSAPARPAATGPVLLVDDNVDARDGLAQLLRMRGYQVELAHDGASALDVARKSGPRAVLLDIGLPGQDGYEVARELRAEPRLQDATVIAVTGYGGPDERYRAREAGFDHYLTKPVDLDVLVGLLGGTQERGREK